MCACLKNACLFISRKFWWKYHYQDSHCYWVDPSFSALDCQKNPKSTAHQRQKLRFSEKPSRNIANIACWISNRPHGHPPTIAAIAPVCLQGLPKGFRNSDSFQQLIYFWDAPPPSTSHPRRWHYTFSDGDPTIPSLAPFGGAKMGRKLGLGVKGVVASLSSHRFWSLV